MLDYSSSERMGFLYTESGQTSQGSFSAVSTPIFASKYALESSRRDLHNALLCTVLNAQNFRQKSLKILLIFSPGWIGTDFGGEGMGKVHLELEGQHRHREEICGKRSWAANL